MTIQQNSDIIPTHGTVRTPFSFMFNHRLIHPTPYYSYSKSLMPFSASESSPAALLSLLE